MDFICSFFDDSTHSVNKICAQLATDIPTIRHVLGGLPFLASLPILMVFAFSIAFFSSWKLALVMLIILPIIVVNAYIEFSQKVSIDLTNAIIMLMHREISRKRRRGSRFSQIPKTENRLFKNMPPIFCKFFS